MTGAVLGVGVAECFRDDVRMADWERVGKYVVARRVELGYKQRGDFAAALGVSARVVSDLENGRRGNFDSVTIASLENVLGWETGSFARVAAGGEPAMRDTDVPHPPVTAGARTMPDEIEMIYASRSMTAQEKLVAIRMVLHLRQQAEKDVDRQAADAPDQSTVDYKN